MGYVSYAQLFDSLPFSDLFFNFALKREIFTLFLIVNMKLFARLTKASLSKGQGVGNPLIRRWLRKERVISVLCRPSSNYSGVDTSTITRNSSGYGGGSVSKRLVSNYESKILGIPDSGRGCIEYSGSVGDAISRLDSILRNGNLSAFHRVRRSINCARFPVLLIVFTRQLSDRVCERNPAGFAQTRQ